MARPLRHEGHSYCRIGVMGRVWVTQGGASDAPDIETGGCRTRSPSFFVAASPKLLLAAPRELILAFGRDKRILASHLQIAVAGDLGRFNSASADLLPPSDVRAPETVRS
jgi:hypothetical protein